MSCKGYVQAAQALSALRQGMAVAPGEEPLQTMLEIQRRDPCVAQKPCGHQAIIAPAAHADHQSPGLLLKQLHLLPPLLSAHHLHLKHNIYNNNSNIIYMI